jgi:hypothetical protein
MVTTAHSRIRLSAPSSASTRTRRSTGWQSSPGAISSTYVIGRLWSRQRVTTQALLREFGGGPSSPAQEGFPARRLGAWYEAGCSHLMTVGNAPMNGDDEDEPTWSVECQGNEPATRFFFWHNPRST